MNFEPFSSFEVSNWHLQGAAGLPPFFLNGYKAYRGLIAGSPSIVGVYGRSLQRLSEEKASPSCSGRTSPANSELPLSLVDHPQLHWKVRCPVSVSDTALLLVLSWFTLLLDDLCLPPCHSLVCLSSPSPIWTCCASVLQFPHAGLV